MRIENISIKTVTASILLLFGICSIVLSFVLTSQNRQAAIQVQAQGMSHAIKVATHELIADLEKHAINLGITLQSNRVLRDAIIHQPENNPLVLDILDTPFDTGYIGEGTVELAQIRLYDLDFNLLAESRKGIQNLPHSLPAFLKEQALPRQGAHRLKAISGLWVSQHRPLHSTLVPFGGLNIKGYFEIIIDPMFNLPTIVNMLQLPVNIYATDGRTLYESFAESVVDSSRLPVEHILHASDGTTAYRIVVFDTLQALDANMEDTHITIISAFLALSAGTILLTLWLLNRFLFQPVNRMANDMKNCTKMDSCISIDGRGLKEFHSLAEAFNSMSDRVQSSMKNLTRLSSQDGLTGIANRRYLDDMIESEWKRATRQQLEISLLLIDIDCFKLYNDTYGHQAGDQCLQSIAGALKSVTSRSCDLVARYGGEEFVILLPDTSAEGAIQVANNLLEEIHKLHIPHKSSLVSDIVTASIGVGTLLPKKVLPHRLLVKLADNALYEAKENGRNCVQASTHRVENKVVAF